MRVLVYTTSSNDVVKLLDSLRCQKEHDLHVFCYDRKWHDHMAEIQQKAGNRADATVAAAGQKAMQELNQGIYKMPSDVDVTCDVDMLHEIDRVRPDMAIYVSAYEGKFVPMNETLAAINRKVPLVHMCCDAADPPWHPQMVTFDRDKCFSLTWNIDGSHQWPGGKDWDVEEKHVAWGALPPAGYQGPQPRLFYPVDIPLGWKINGLTTLTPVDPSYFQGPDLAFEDRPFRIGYAGNFGGLHRSALIQFMENKFKGVFIPYRRDDHPHSYSEYCRYLKYCQCVINVPFSGSNAAKQVKGRIVEAGWAGCAAMDWEGSPSFEWFDGAPIIYRGMHDLEQVVANCLDHPDCVQTNAELLARRVREEHSPEIIWNQVFAAVKSA